MKKRILSLLLAILTVLALCAPAMAYGIPGPSMPDGVCGPNARWSLDTSRGTLTVYGAGALNVSAYENEGMVGMLYGEPWVIFTLVVKEGITDLDCMFRGCPKLKGISLPSTLKQLGEYEFSECPLLKTVTIPKTVKRILSCAFDGCTNLTSVTILNKNCEIGADRNTLGVPGVTVISGYAGSTAQSYARRYGYVFRTIHDDGWATEGGKRYYYKNNVKVTGLWVISGKRYYFSVKDGHMMTGLVQVDSKGTVKYFSTKNGAMLKGLVNTGGGKTRYFSAKDGAMLKGLVTTDSKGTQRYFSAKDGHMMTGLVQVDNKGTVKYFSTKNGAMLKGLVTTDSKGTQRYFSTRDGHMMKSGWIYVNGRPRYYANASGVITKKR